MTKQYVLSLKHSGKTVAMTFTVPVVTVLDFGSEPLFADICLKKYVAIEIDATDYRKFLHDVFDEFVALRRRFAAAHGDSRQIDLYVAGNTTLERIVHELKLGEHFTLHLIHPRNDEGG